MEIPGGQGSGASHHGTVRVSTQSAGLKQTMGSDRCVPCSVLRAPCSVLRTCSRNTFSANKHRCNRAPAPATTVLCCAPTKVNGECGVAPSRSSRDDVLHHMSQSGGDLSQPSTLGQTGGAADI